MCTLKALKYNGGVAKEDVKLENVAAVAKGFVNLKGHIENMRRFKINPIVVLNKYDFDTDKEIAKLKALCEEMGVSICETNVFMKGGEGAIELANKVVEECAKDNNDFQFLYNTNDNIRQKIHKIAVDIYGADGVEYTKQAEEAIAKIEQINRGDLPICIAKTQYSFSDNPKLLGKPTNYKIKIRDVILKNGAGFIVAIAGNIMTMPGLPKEPAAEKIYVAEDGDTIVGLF